MKHLADGRRELPAVGDWVAVRVDSARATQRMIRGDPPRGTACFPARRRAGRPRNRSSPRTSTSVFLVFGLDTPAQAPGHRALSGRGRAERRAAGRRAEQGATSHPDVAEAVAEVDGGCRRGPRACDVSTREDHPSTRLVAYLAPGRTIALLGPSGAGKSSIVNRLVGRELLADRRRARVGCARPAHQRASPARGPREGGLIIDTPGMRELQLWDADEAFGDTFADIAALGGGVPLSRLPARPRARLRGQGRGRCASSSTPAATRATCKLQREQAAHRAEARRAGAARRQASGEDSAARRSRPCRSNAGGRRPLKYAASPDCTPPCHRRPAAVHRFARTVRARAASSVSADDVTSCHSSYRDTYRSSSRAP